MTWLTCHPRQGATPGGVPFHPTPASDTWWCTLLSHPSISPQPVTHVAHPSGVPLHYSPLSHPDQRKWRTQVAGFGVHSSVNNVLTPVGTYSDGCHGQTVIGSHCVKLNAVIGQCSDATYLSKRRTGIKQYLFVYLLKIIQVHILSNIIYNIMVQ